MSLSWGHWKLDTPRPQLPNQTRFQKQWKPHYRLTYMNRWCHLRRISLHKRFAGATFQIANQATDKYDGAVRVANVICHALEMASGIRGVR